MTRKTRGEAEVARRLTPSGEIWTRRSARRADTTAAIGTPIDDDRDVDPLKREVARGQRRAREGDAVEQRSEEKEQDETERHSGEGRNRRLYGRDHRDLPRRGTHEPHGGEALLSPGGGQPTGGGYQDEHG